MATVVLAIGIVIVAFGFWALLLPVDFQRRLGTLWQRHAALHAAILLRVVLGVALLGAAGDSRFPLAFRVLAAISILAAIAGYALGFDRLRSWIDWWRAQSPGFIRGWSLLALALGAFLVYGVA